MARYIIPPIDSGGGTTSGTSTPTVGAIGAITSASCTLYWTKVGDRVLWHAIIDITTNGAGGTFLTLNPMPHTALERAPLYGHCLSLATGNNGYVASTTAYILKYDGTYPGFDGATFYVGGQYRA